MNIRTLLKGYWDWASVSLDKYISNEFAAQNGVGSGSGYYDSWMTADIYWNVWLVLMFASFLFATAFSRWSVSDGYEPDGKWVFGSALFWCTLISFSWPAIVWVGYLALFPLPFLAIGMLLWAVSAGMFKGYDGARYLHSFRQKRRELTVARVESERRKRLNDPTYQESLNELEVWLKKERQLVV